MNRLLTTIMAVLLLAGVSIAEGAMLKGGTAGLTLCTEPRPEICTRDYRPVCAQMKDGTLKTYSNGCTSCTYRNVISYQNGDCETLSSGDQAAQLKKAKAVRTFAFTCVDGFTFVARAENETVWVFLPSGTLELQKTSADTFRNEKAVFRIKGQESLLVEPGGKHTECRNNRRQAIWEHAKLNGADFRAIGNEPGWTLEIRNQSEIVLVTGYGSDRYEFDLPEPETDRIARITRYKVEQDGQEMTLTISGESCSDSMSGETFESTVEVVLNGKTLHGCGRALH